MQLRGIALLKVVNEEPKKGLKKFFIAARDGACLCLGMKGTLVAMSEGMCIPAAAGPSSRATSLSW